MSDISSVIDRTTATRIEHLYLQLFVVRLQSYISKGFYGYSKVVSHQDRHYVTVSVYFSKFDHILFLNIFEKDQVRQRLSHIASGEICRLSPRVCCK